MLGRASHRWLEASLAVVAAAGCGYDWTFVPDGGSPDAAPDAALDAGGRDVGFPVGPDADGGPARNACETPCPSGWFCDFEDNACGRLLGRVGTCRAPSPSCDPSKVRCGCTGMRADECTLQRSGVDIDPSEQACPTFPCGVTRCAAQSQYCLLEGGVGRCLPLGCVPADCTCRELPPLPCSCEGSVAGQITMKCP